MKSLTFIEIDVDTFTPASPAEETTFRFAQPTDYLPRTLDFDAIPSIMSVSFTPATISLGGDLGQRATLTVTLRDHRHIMADEPFEQGSFWGKWRARYGTRLRGRALRWINGLLGQTLAEMETRHFIVESTEGPTPAGTYTIVAKDALKLVDGDRSQAPLLSEGSLVADVLAAAGSFTLTPAGIGNAFYPASGHVAVGGEEIMAFTRSGDVMTVTRAQFNTVAVDHEAGDRAQLCLFYEGEDPADIIYDLMVTYGGIDPAWIDLSSWQNETAAYLQRVYTALIAEPTDVRQLVDELIEQAALAIWWDPLTERIRLQVLRAILTDADRFTEMNTLEGSLQVQEQPNTRVSQVWTYFGLRNPLEPLDEENNYRSTLLTIAPDEELGYGSEAIRKIFSRWIPFGGRTVAERLNNIVLGRFKDPPRRFTFATQRYNGTDPLLGQGYQLESRIIQTVEGLPTQAPIQITRLNPRPERFEIEAEEVLFENLDPTDLVDRVIIIDANAFSLNMRTLHDSLYPDPTGTESPPITVTCVIEAGVMVGSTSATIPAFDVGDWPAGFDETNLTLEVRGDIRGAGGQGGNGGNADGTNHSGKNGHVGGTALYTRQEITLIDEFAKLYGGGGGGGGGASKGGGGGGGAGAVPGEGGPKTTSEGSPDPTPGSAGSLDLGGGGGDGADSSDFDGGAGGTPGMVGVAGEGLNLGPNSTGGAGGAGGNSIDGISFITQVGPEGDRLGPEVN